MVGEASEIPARVWGWLTVLGHVDECRSDIKDVLASLKISENKDLEKIGGFVLVKDTPEGDLLVVRSWAEQYSALSNVCPHKQCRVEVKSSALIQCPCHHSAYRIDGTFISGPAQTSLKKFQVRVEGDLIAVLRD